MLIKIEFFIQMILNINNLKVMNHRTFHLKLYSYVVKGLKSNRNYTRLLTHDILRVSSNFFKYKKNIQMFLIFFSIKKI
jgi:hypothetical protein